MSAAGGGGGGGVGTGGDSASGYGGEAGIGRGGKSTSTGIVGYGGGAHASGSGGGQGGSGTSTSGGTGNKGKSAPKSWSVTQAKNRAGENVGPKTVTAQFTTTSSPTTFGPAASEGALAVSKALIGKYGSVIGNPTGFFMAGNLAQLGLATFGYALANTGGYTPGVPGPQGSSGLPTTYEQLMAMDERSRPSRLNYPELYKIPPVTSAGPPTIPDPAMVDLGETRVINALSFQSSPNLLLSEEEEATTLGGV